MMTGNDYSDLAMRTNDGKINERLRTMVNMVDVVEFGEIINACLGLSGEIGELNDLVKKWVFHEKTVDFSHLKKELGDVLWYVALMCHAFHWELDDVMKLNIDKLMARYPEGFDTTLANNRKVGDI